MALYDSKLNDGEPAAPGEEALVAKLREMANKMTQLYVITGVYSAAALYLTIAAALRYGNAGLLTLVPGFIILLLLLLKLDSAKKEMKLFFCDNIVRGVLDETLELTEYSPLLYLEDGKINSSALFKGWNSINGSDLIEGEYKGVKFSFSDIHLEKITGSGKSRHCKTLFRGQWLICELRRNIPQRLQLSERAGLDFGQKKSAAETDNADFNKKFHISAADPQSALRLLTPNFTEQLMKLDSHADARTYISISGNQAHIALHNGRDLFEPIGREIYTNSNIEPLRKTIRWDVRYITGVIDILLENECLFKKT